MLDIKKQTLKALQSGELSVAAFAEELINNYPTKAIALAFAELLTTQPEPVDKILVTEEQFNKYFKIKGINSVTGLAEHRGRKPKDNGEKTIKVK